MEKVGRMKCQGLRWAAGLYVLVLLAGCGRRAGVEERTAQPVSSNSATSKQDKAGDSQGGHQSEATTGGAPGEMAGFVFQGDQVVAQAREDLDGDGTVDAVVIVRRQSTESGTNPCELLVLRRREEQLAVSARSRHVVECLYNTVARNAASLQDNLKVARGEIVYTNQREKGTSVYRFNYDQAGQAWFLGEALNSYPQYNEAADKVDLVREVVSYPKDVGWTTLDLFNPDALEGAFAKNRKIME